MQSGVDVPSSPSGRFSSLFAHGAGSLAAGLFGQSLTIASVILTARLLGPSGKGELTAILLWPALILYLGGVTSLGEAIVFSLSQSPQSSKRSDAAAVLVISVVQAAFFTTVSYWVLPLVFSSYSREVLESLRVYLLWIPFAVVTNNGLSIVLGRQQVGVFNVLRIVAPAITAIALVWVAFSNVHTLRPAVIAYLFGAGTGALVVLVAVALGGLSWPSGARVRSMFVYALKGHVGSISGLANERADQALISVVLPPAALGLYSVAVSVTSPVVMIGTSLAPVVLARVSDASVSVERNRRLIGFVKAAALLSAAAVLFIFILTQPIISLLFGGSFAEATLPCQILLLAAFALSIKNVFNAGLKGSNRPLTTSVAEGLGVLATVGLLILLLPRYGIAGAAVASCIAYWGTAGYMLFAISRHGGVRPVDLVPRRDDFAAWGKAISNFASGLRPPSGPSAAKHQDR